MDSEQARASEHPRQSFFNFRFESRMPRNDSSNFFQYFYDEIIELVFSTRLHIL